VYRLGSVAGEVVTGEVVEAEALDPVVRVEVAARLALHGVGTPLDHPERGDRARERVLGTAAGAEVGAARFGAGERVDVLREIAGFQGGGPGLRRRGGARGLGRDGGRDRGDQCGREDQHDLWQAGAPPGRCGHQLGSPL
jgi:hypothetical protein